MKEDSIAQSDLFDNLIKKLSHRTKDYHKFEQYILLTNPNKDEKYERELKLVLPFLFDYSLRNVYYGGYAYPTRQAEILDLQYEDENTIEAYYPKELARAQTPEREKLIKKFEKRYKKNIKNKVYDNEVKVKRNGKAYDENGILIFEGRYNEIWRRGKIERLIYFNGKEFYADGKIKREGKFSKYGFVSGRTYYPNGRLRFEGIFNDKTKDGLGNYYGPQYPLYGDYYSENGEKLFSGRFYITYLGSMFYPKIIVPEGITNTDLIGN